MSRYSKAIAGVLSVLVARGALMWFGIDFNAMGVGGDLNLLMMGAVDAAITAAAAGVAIWRSPKNAEA